MKNILSRIKNNDTCDVIIECNDGDGKSIKFHKIFLMEISNYFKSSFRFQNTETNKQNNLDELWLSGFTTNSELYRFTTNCSSDSIKYFQDLVYYDDHQNVSIVDYADDYVIINLLIYIIADEILFEHYWNNFKKLKIDNYCFKEMLDVYFYFLISITNKYILSPNFIQCVKNDIYKIITSNSLDKTVRTKIRFYLLNNYSNSLNDHDFFEKLVKYPTDWKKEYIEILYERTKFEIHENGVGNYKIELSFGNNDHRISLNDDKYIIDDIDYKKMSVESNNRDFIIDIQKKQWLY